MDKKEREREELHRAIWAIADELRGAVDGWDFKNYVLGAMFYRWLSEDLTAHVKKTEREGSEDYVKLSDDEAEKDFRENLVNTKGFFILPSELFCNVLARAERDETERKNLNETLGNVFRHIEEFEGKDVLESRELEDYKGKYLDLRDALTPKREKGERTDITDSIVFEIELIEQAAVGVDTILMLVEKYRDVPRKDKRIFFEDIESKIRSDVQLRSKKELILNFVKGIKPGDDVAGTWHDYVAEQYETQLADIIKEEHLKDLETRRFMKNAFLEGEVPTVGMGIDDTMPSISRKNGERERRRCNILKKLTDFFERFFGIFHP